VTQTRPVSVAYAQSSSPVHVKSPAETVSSMHAPLSPTGVHAASLVAKLRPVSAPQPVVVRKRKEDRRKRRTSELFILETDL
jgi:hypothetical protein